MWSGCVCVGRYTHSQRGPIAKEDNTVPGWGKGPSWKLCKKNKTMGAVAKKLQSKQNKENRRCPIAGVYTLV